MWWGSLRIIYLWECTFALFECHFKMIYNFSKFQIKNCYHSVLFSSENLTYAWMSETWL